MMGGHSVASPCDDFTKGVHLRRAPLVRHGASSAGTGREQAGASAKDTAERHHRETPQSQQRAEELNNPAPRRCEIYE